MVFAAIFNRFHAWNAHRTTSVNAAQMGAVGSCSNLTHIRQPESESISNNLNVFKSGSKQVVTICQCHRQPQPMHNWPPSKLHNTTRRTTNWAETPVQRDSMTANTIHATTTPTLKAMLDRLQFNPATCSSQFLNSNNTFHKRNTKFQHNTHTTWTISTTPNTSQQLQTHTDFNHQVSPWQFQVKHHQINEFASRGNLIEINLEYFWNLFQVNCLWAERRTALVTVSTKFKLVPIIFL